MKRKSRGSWGYTWRCRHCGKPCGGYTPNNGDGTIQLLYRHNTPAGDLCFNNLGEEYDNEKDAILDQLGRNQSKN